MHARVGGAEPVLDGRTARSVRTRRAIVDALRALFAEGDLRPTAERVADRAGVSVRTVWQHFEDLEALITEAGERDLERAQSFVADIDVDLPVAERIAQLLDQRVAMYEAMSPSWRAARLHAPFSATIRRNRDELMAIGRRQVEDVFAPELRAARDRETKLDALEIACAWAAWESLRDDAHLEVDRAKAALTAWLAALCAAP